jgi:phosphatidylglycerophosphate synthase
MLDRVLRGPKDRMLRPLVRRIGPHANPTALTVLGFTAGLAAAAALWVGALGVSLSLWVFNRLLDGIDGAVAREASRTSDLGGYVDILLDMVIYALIPVAAAVAAPEQPGLWLALAFLLGSFYVNAGSWMYLSAILEKRGTTGAHDRATSVEFPSGLVEGTETMVLFTLIILFPPHLATLYWVGAGLVMLTAAQRLLWAMRHL